MEGNYCVLNSKMVLRTNSKFLSRRELEDLLEKNTFEKLPREVTSVVFSKRLNSSFRVEILYKNKAHCIAYIDPIWKKLLSSDENTFNVKDSRTKLFTNVKFPIDVVEMEKKVKSLLGEDLYMEPAVNSAYYHYFFEVGIKLPLLEVAFKDKYGEKFFVEFTKR